MEGLGDILQKVGEFPCKKHLLKLSERKQCIARQRWLPLAQSTGFEFVLVQPY